MMEAFHREQLPLDGVMGLIEQSDRGGHLRVLEDRIPARLFVLEPAPHALTIGLPSFMSHVVSKVAEPLPQRHHAQALALAYPMEELSSVGFSLMPLWAAV